MNNNTILRIKVPAYLYESVKKQLTLKEGKASKAYGDWKVVKEKKAPKENTKKIEEVEETNEAMNSTNLESLSSKVLKDFYERVKQMEAEGTDLESAIHFAKFDTANPKGETEDLKEYEVTYVYVNGQCYRKDDEGNKTRVDNSKCGRHDRRVGGSDKKHFPRQYNNQND